MKKVVYNYSGKWYTYSRPYYGTVCYYKRLEVKNFIFFSRFYETPEEELIDSRLVIDCGVYNVRN